MCTGPLPIGTPHVDDCKLTFGVPQRLQERTRRPQRPFGAAGRSWSQELNRFAEREAQTAASVASAPVMRRSRRASVDRSAERSTTMSTMPCSARNYDV